MNTQAILHLALVLHLIALATAMGITLAGTIISRQFWKLYDENKEQGLAVFRATAKFGVFGMASFFLLILTGLLMLWLYDWSLTQLLWFKLKLAVVVLLFVNGFTMGRTTFGKMEAILEGKHSSNASHAETLDLRRKMHLFQLTQLSLFVVIIILSVFRFT